MIVYRSVWLAKDHLYCSVISSKKNTKLIRHGILLLFECHFDARTQTHSHVRTACDMIRNLYDNQTPIHQKRLLLSAQTDRIYAESQNKWLLLKCPLCTLSAHFICMLKHFQKRKEKEM